MRASLPVVVLAPLPAQLVHLPAQQLVIPRKPEGTPHGRRLLNGAGVGLVEIDGQGAPWLIRTVHTDGRMVQFNGREEESRWR
jgi:hypothetical protein